MKKVFCIMMLAVICILPIANASESNKQVQAYENKDMIIVYRDQPVTFADNGTILSPLMYQGMTYVPLLPFSDLIKLETRWDKETSTMYLGPSEEGIDFIDEIPAYSVTSSISGTVNRYATGERDAARIASRTYSNWIWFSGSHTAYYDLEGKYNTLTLKAYSEDDNTILFKGDNKSLIGKFEIIGRNLPQTISIDVTNVFQLEISVEDAGDYSDTFIVDAFIK